MKLALIIGLATALGATASYAELVGSKAWIYGLRKTEENFYTTLKQTKLMRVVGQSSTKTS